MDADALFAGTPVWIISDVHLGAPQCRLGALHAFLDALPAAAGLILNGDTFEGAFDPAAAPPGHREMLLRLEAESRARPVVWIRGNNDPRPETLVKGAFDFRDGITFGTRLHVEHGNRYDHLRPPLKPLMYGFKAMYDRFGGGRRLHVTALAARIPFAFRVLTWQMSRAAAAAGRARGVAAVACGHSHDPSDRVVRGVRYLNTGCWAGTGACAVRVTGDGVELVPCDTGPVN